jgi:hypothetical protein
MASWHQNKAGVSGLYDPHPTGWKVITDRHNEMASSIILESKEAADTYVKAQPHGIIVPPGPLFTPPARRTRSGPNR